MGLFNKYVLACVLFVQIVTAFFFISEILISILGLQVAPYSWKLHEFIEISAGVALLFGVLIGSYVLRTAWTRTLRAEEALRAARSAFREVMEERFASWELTPAEHDVALFAIKGFSTGDMASLRGVSEGTIKAQTAAIYRKADVSGRAQLLSIFIDELIEKEDDQSSLA